MELPPAQQADMYAAEQEKQKTGQEKEGIGRPSNPLCYGK